MINELRHFALRIGYGLRLAARIIGNARLFPGGIGDCLRLVIEIVGVTRQQIIVLRRAVQRVVAHFEQIDAIRMIGVSRRTPHRINAARGVSQAIVGELRQLCGAPN